MAFSFFKSWVEFFFFVLMVLGAIIALFAKSAVISYIVIFLSGMFAGRIIYFKHHGLKTGYYIILFGYLIGGVLSYYLFKKKVLRDITF